MITQVAEFPGQPPEPQTTIGPAGGNGGSPFSRKCAAGQVVTTILGRSAKRVDKIDIFCSTVAMVDKR